MHTSAIYTIRIVGILDENWSGRLGGLTVSTVKEPDQGQVTMLEGPLVDQAALFGVLNAFYDMLLPLLSVECAGWA
jgi:hypothetical protein